MDYQWSAVRKGMDVYDVNGDKIGSVGEIYAGATVGAGTSTTSGVSASGNYIKVDTGFLGLGKDYYVPAEYVSEVIDDKVVLNLTKDATKTMGWDNKPASLEGLD
ncbi:MAG TPA: PRC-barrel domain containing protein [Chloroflexota bacterium]|jgi:hypothetical protein|nr:PRC-barrel domain containing protein [Chloroflexota bacterium]